MNTTSSHSVVIQPPLMWVQHSNPHLRLGGKHPPAASLLPRGEKFYSELVRAQSTTPPPGQDDYALIDPELPLDMQGDSSSPASRHTGYAGLNAIQRGAFFIWLKTPTQEAPPTFRRLYLAQLEAQLLEPKAKRRRAAHQEIQRLAREAAWRQDDDLQRAALLATWLAQDGSFLAEILASGALGPDLCGVACGWQAHLGRPLDAGQVIALAQAWDLQPQDALGRLRGAGEGVLQLRLNSLATALGAEPLQYALSQTAPPQPPAEGSPEAGPPFLRAAQWRPWRTVHRDLRLLLPQVDLGPHLRPLLADLLAGDGGLAPVRAPGEPPQNAEVQPPRPQIGWQLILEFGDTRSQYYDYVVAQARKRPTYRLLMDEDRRMVHRVTYRKRDMRHFWRLWKFVQKWSSMHVYVNGEELEAWKVWPYSPALR